MKLDDGKGPYDYCKRGLSHCEDQFCECVDTAKYRALYVRAREQFGEAIGMKPHQLALWLVSWTVGGMIVGLAIFLAWISS